VLVCSFLFFEKEIYDVFVSKRNKKLLRVELTTCHVKVIVWCAVAVSHVIVTLGIISSFSI